MLVLLCQIGGHRYALDASQIREVLPLVDIFPMPSAPSGIAGVFDFRGAPVPVIDLSLLLTGRPAPRRMSTRLVVIDYRQGGGAPHQLGLLTERATRTLRWEATTFVDSGISDERTPYLGGVASGPDGLVQQIDVGRLLPSAVREALFKNRVEM